MIVTRVCFRLTITTLSLRTFSESNVYGHSCTVQTLTTLLLSRFRVSSLGTRALRIDSSNMSYKGSVPCSVDHTLEGIQRTCGRAHTYRVCQYNGAPHWHFKTCQGTDFCPDEPVVIPQQIPQQQAFVPQQPAVAQQAPLAGFPNEVWENIFKFVYAGLSNNLSKDLHWIRTSARELSPRLCSIVDRTLIMEAMKGSELTLRNRQFPQSI